MHWQSSQQNVKIGMGLTLKWGLVQGVQISLISMISHIRNSLKHTVCKHALKAVVVMIAGNDLSQETIAIDLLTATN